MKIGRFGIAAIIGALGFAGAAAPPMAKGAEVVPSQRHRGPRVTGGGSKVRSVNPKRRKRTQLMLEHGITTGRQWVRLRRQLKLEA